MPEEAKEILQKLNSMSFEERQQYNCEQLNKTTGNLEGYDCKECLNRGYMNFLNEDHEIKQRLCNCHNKRISHNRLKRLGLLTQVERCTFDTYKTTSSWQEKIKALALQYKDNCLTTLNWFYIGGQSGAGKTHLCSAIIKELIEQMCEVQYMPWRDSLQRIKANTMNDRERQELFEPLKKAQILYIDDFLKPTYSVEGISKNPTDADINTAFELLNYRYNNNLITIISSELDIQQATEIDEATGGRIKEKAGGYCLRLNKDSKKNYRLNK